MLAYFSAIFASWEPYIIYLKNLTVPENSLYTKISLINTIQKYVCLPIISLYSPVCNKTPCTPLQAKVLGPFHTDQPIQVVPYKIQNRKRSQYVCQIAWTIPLPSYAHSIICPQYCLYGYPSYTSLKWIPTKIKYNLLSFGVQSKYDSLHHSILGFITLF